MARFVLKGECGVDAETLEHGTRVYTNGVHRVCADALLLARFSQPAPHDKAADLCAGCGTVALAWHDAGHRGPCLAAEIDPAGAALIARGAAEPGCDHIRAECADIRALPGGAGLDVCAANPPYFTGGAKSASPARAAARHDDTCTVADVCGAARRLLRMGGRLCICMRPERLADVICAMREAGIEPKRLQFVSHSAGKAPFLALVEGRRGGGAGLCAEPTLLLREEV